MSELKKQLGVWDVYAVSAGAMISSGLFILPALAYLRSGPGLLLAYFLAAVLVIPSMFSKAELSTAMPRAGGTYFFVERSMGTIWGLFSGFAGWFSLALKSAFAIVGMVYLIEVVCQEFGHIELSPLALKVIGSLCCVFFAVLNLVSVKHTSRFQIVLVGLLLTILLGFAVHGTTHMHAQRFTNFLQAGWLEIFATAGLVFVSFGGLTKVASIAEEVKNPGRNIPLGMLTACFSVTVVYLVVIAVVVGVLEGSELEGSHLPISAAAAAFAGQTGFVLMSLAAIAAFVTTANGGILAASRSPMAMSRDQLLPASLCRVSQRFHTPTVSIVVTALFMITAICFLNLESLVKTASTLKIILFILDNACMLIMRSSRIQSYRPQFKSPLHLAFHWVAIVIYFLLIVKMGKVPLLITAGFLGVSVIWYFVYAHQRVERASALMHVVERVTDRTLKTVTLEDELRDILIERDQIVEDRFDKLVRGCEILDLPESIDADSALKQVAGIMASRFHADESQLFELFLERERETSTVIEPGLAIPHVIVEGENLFDIVLVRAREGIQFPNQTESVRVMFALAGSRDERNYHLRALMAIAQIAQEKGFRDRWMDARDAEGIRNMILVSTRKRDEN